MAKEIIATANAPKAIGPYSQASKSGGFIFTSGQLGIDPATGTLCEGISAQVRQALENLKAVLAEGGCDFGAVLKTTVFLSDMQDFAVFNEIYKSYFDCAFPSRSCVAVAGLPMGALVEIEAVAHAG